MLFGRCSPFISRWLDFRVAEIFRLWISGGVYEGLQVSAGRQDEFDIFRPKQGRGSVARLPGRDVVSQAGNNERVARYLGQVCLVSGNVDLTRIVERKSE